jgi:hypothetical protein
MKKKLFAFTVLLLIGIQMNGCSKNQKEFIFETSKVNSKQGAGFVDVIEPAEQVLVNGIIHVGGWSYDPYKKSNSKGVIILSDAKQISVSPQIGAERPDVAKALNNKELLKSGWDTSFKATLLGTGRHKLEFYTVLNDGTFAPLIYRGKTSFEIEVAEK